MKFLSKLFGRGESDTTEPQESDAAQASEVGVRPEPEVVAEAEPEVVPEAEPEIVAEPEPEVTPEIVPEPEVTPEIVPEIDTQSPPESLDKPAPEEVKPETVPVTASAAAVATFDETLETSSDPQQSLTLGRACRQAGQLQESVAHYQQYLRSFSEVSVFEELADVFEELGDTYMASSSRMVANSLKK